jgi:hypothetical protein
MNGLSRRIFGPKRERENERHRGKGEKVKLSLCFFFLTEHHAMNAYWRSRDIAPYILDLGTRWSEW